VVARPDGSDRIALDPPARRTPPTWGGTWCWCGEDAVVLVAADGRLVHVALGGPVVEVLPADGTRRLGPAVSPDGRWVACAAETPTDQRIVVAPISGGPAQHVSTADFAWDPAWSPSGDAIAWHEWDDPAMPWDASRIVIAAVVDGIVGTPVVVAGRVDEQVGQPRWSPDGRHLAWVSDRTGWLTVWVADARGADPYPLVLESFEAAEAPWGAGQRSFAWSPDARSIAYCRNEDGFGALQRVAVTGESVGTSDLVARAWHHGIDWTAHGILGVRSGARTPPRIVVHGEDGSRIDLADGDPPGFSRDALVEPEVVRWRSGASEVSGLLYRPAGAQRPPVLVDCHGGPTGAATVRWIPDVADLVARGWAVLRPNPRGSTGSGRRFLRDLDGGWGAVDVDDVIAGIESARARADLGGDRIAIGGGSAGGMLALLVALRRPDLVRACAVSYPVCDLRDLAAVDHRFEGHYTHRLVGVFPDAEDTYVARSPITAAATLRVPTLMLHGDADPVVPIEQTRTFAAAARAGGASVEVVEYEREGHGWSRPETVADAEARTAAFLAREVLA
jgi:dipeptidyl aminopeptidase/acylaminoacyl peptidase